MRRIDKSTDDIARFNTWAKSRKLHEWSDFSSPHAEYYRAFTAVRDHIAIIEQHCLSSYTEKPLGSNIHIDHFRKRSLYQWLKFDYSNFLVDDRNDNYGACFKDNRAGVTKATFDGLDRIFCPVTENMAELVTFTFDGTMLPKNNLEQPVTCRIQKTIGVFNLNHNSLKNMRGDMVKIILEYKKYGLSNEEIRNCMEQSGFPTLVDWALAHFEDVATTK